MTGAGITRTPRVQQGDSNSEDEPENRHLALAGHKAAAWAILVGSPLIFILFFISLKFSDTQEP